MTSKIQVAILNEFQGLSPSQVEKVTAALQKQVSEDFAPVWGIDADVTFYPNGNPPASAWQLIILDNSDQADALGYHDLTAEGQPLGKVFAGTTIRSGSSWTTTASHELLEMLGDPSINLSVLSTDEEGKNILYSYENCDACESDEFGYFVDGVLLSDFVYPSWFEDFHPKGTQYDHGKYIKRAFQLLAGGYIGVYYIDKGHGWEQLYPKSAKLAYDMRPRVGSRRERRKLLREQWLKTAARKGKSGAGRFLHADQAVVTVNYQVNFHGGEGEIFFFGEGFPDHFSINSRMPRDKWAFTVQQSKGDKFITALGAAPDSDDGRITVEVSQGGQVLSPASANTYKKGLFDKIIIYTV